MRVHKEILTCDVCKCETSELIDVLLPIPNYGLGDYIPVHYKTDRVATGKFEICTKCASKIIKVIEPYCERYGDYDYIGSIIEWKNGGEE